MNYKNLSLYAAAVAAIIVGTQNAHATFGVTLKTTQSDTVDTLSGRFYTDNTFSTLMTAGAPVWLVIDTDGDGIWANGSVGNVDYSDGTVLGTAAALRAALIDADDYVGFTTVLGGPNPGRVNTAFVGLSSTLQEGGVGANDAGGNVKNSYALLFDSADFSSGATFGWNGILTESGLVPSSGNVSLRIGENVFADQYTASFVPVPEPAAAAYVGLGLAGLALLRRRMNRA